MYKRQGCAFPEAEQGMNLARNVVFLSDLPKSVGGVTVNRFCASSMQAIHQAAGAIMSGSGDLFIAGGVESMSRVPMPGFNPMLNPSLIDVDAYIGMGHTAENLAKQHSISREEQEKMALESHQKAASANLQKKFEAEIVSINGVTDDGCVRPETSLETMAGLKPAFDKDGVVTAATSSPLTDGAAAVIVCSEDYANKNSLEILAYIRGMAISGCSPEIMGIGPVLSSQKALKRAGIKLEDVDVIEMNEAFAAQSLACVKELGVDMSKLNIHGGAISIGHPLGASGARITGKAASLLKETGKLRLERGDTSPPMDINCQLKSFDLSGHAGHSQIVDFINKCNPEKVILYHGDNREAFSEDLKDYDLILPLENETIEIN